MRTSDPGSSRIATVFVLEDPINHKDFFTTVVPTED
jgi:hypothetical protein